MLWTKKPGATARTGSILALSTLALVAFCCLPVLAHGASAGLEYEDAPPSSAGGSPNKSDLSGGSGSTSGIGSGANSGKAAKSSGGKGGSSKSGSGAGNQGSQGAGGVGGGTALGTSGENAAAPGTDDGGSSPLIPILIAIVVLAGASIAYVVFKRRRAASGDPSDPSSPSSPVSPEAG